MVNNADINSTFGTEELYNCQDAADRLRLYSGLIRNTLSRESYGRKKPSHYINGSKEFGFLINSPTMEMLKEVFEKVFSKKLVPRSAILCAFLYAKVKKCEDNIKESLEKVLAVPNALTRQEFTTLYGEDVLNFVLIHSGYDYDEDIDSVIEYDKKIMLCHDGIIEEVEVTPLQGYVRNRTNRSI